MASTTTSFDFLSTTDADKYDEDDPLLPLYIVMASLTLILCFYVIWSYIRNPAYRKAPAILMLSKTISDLLFSFVFFVMLISNDTEWCQYFGGVFLMFFLTAQFYFMAICWDLYRTLRNPFRRPAADSIKIHLVIWSLGIMAMAVAMGTTKQGLFHYRHDYGICFTCYAVAFNIPNIAFWYIPLAASNIIGVLVTVYAFRRLRSGLEKTFELRQLERFSFHIHSMYKYCEFAQVIKQQLILVCCLTVLTAMIVIPWYMLLYGGDANKQQLKELRKICKESSDPFYNQYVCSDDCRDDVDPGLKNYTKFRVLLSVLILLNGSSDALAWFLTHKFIQHPRKEKLAKVIDLKNNDNTTAATGLIESQSNSTTDKDDLDNLASPTEEDTKIDKSPQNVSNALRGEIILFMSAGLARSIHNTARETFRQMYSYADDGWNDGMFRYNDDEEEVEPHLLKYATASKSQSRKLADVLNCEEPEPQRARYAKDIHHDPKSHKGVINEIYVHLPTQQMSNKKAVVRRIATLMAGSSRQNSEALVDQQTIETTQQLQQSLNSSNLHKTNSSTYEHGHIFEEQPSENNHAHKPQQQEEDDRADAENEEDEEERLLSSLNAKPKILSSDTHETMESDEVELSVRKTAKSDFQAPHQDDADLEPEPEPEAMDDAENADVEHHKSVTHTFTRAISSRNYTSLKMTTEPTFNGEQGRYTMHQDNDSTKDGVPFKDYAPHVFRYLRQQIYGVSDEEYFDSVRPPDAEEHTKLVQEKFSEGRSGAFFFFTPDSKYMIKTVTKEEASLLLRILPAFVDHFGKNPKTLINRFFGLHSITMYNLNLYFVVLENIFVAGNQPHETYDIKGSWIDRHTHHHVESGKLMKDQDLHKTLKLMPDISDEMYQQLDADSTFLASQNIMDYSVLLGIYYVGIDPSDVKNDRIMQHHHDNATSNSYIPPLRESIAEEVDAFYMDEQKRINEDAANNLVRTNEHDEDMTQEEKEENDNENENEQQDEEEEQKMQLTKASNLNQSLTLPYPTEMMMETSRTLHVDDLQQAEPRRRAPSYATGLRTYAAKDKAVIARVIEGPGIYYLGIIDVLQEWNTMKKLERMTKVYLRCKSKKGISCVEPQYYRRRFLRKMYRIGIRPVDAKKYMGALH